MKAKLYVTLVRVVRTFVATFAAQMLVTNNTYSEQAIMAAACAGLIAVLNLTTAQPAT